MSDYLADGAAHQIRREPSAEFSVYFVLIFGLGLLPQTVGWLFQTMIHPRRNRTGPVARAWKDAQAITPMIFRG